MQGFVSWSRYSWHVVARTITRYWIAGLLGDRSDSVEYPARYCRCIHFHETIALTGSFLSTTTLFVLLAYEPPAQAGGTWVLT